jgi:LPS-assembly lipoprotein
MKNIAFLWVLMFALVGCGEAFHLRGSSPLPQLMQDIYVQGVGAQSAFGVALREGLQSAGASVKQEAKNAPVVLDITALNEGRTVSGYSSTRQVREFNHTVDVTFHVIGKGLGEAQERSVHVERSQLYNGTYVLGATEEEATIKEELRREAVRLVILRLRAVVPSAK